MPKFSKIFHALGFIELAAIVLFLHFFQCKPAWLCLIKVALATALVELVMYPYMAKEYYRVKGKHLKFLFLFTINSDEPKKKS